MEGSILTHKYTLVPTQFFSQDKAQAFLGEVARIDGNESIKSIALEELGAVLVYAVSPVQDSKGAMPEIFWLLKSLGKIADYNKIICSYAEGYLHLAVAQGRSLLLANSFKAEDFTTAEYFIFLALKNLQLNPEVSTICWRTTLANEEKMSLYRYFKSVEEL